MGFKNAVWGEQSSREKSKIDWYGPLSHIMINWQFLRWYLISYQDYWCNMDVFPSPTHIKHDSCKRAAIQSKHSLYVISQWREKLSKLSFSRAGCEQSVSRLCEQSMMKSHISHISRLHSALPPNTVFNKHSKAASRQYWNDSMSSHVGNIIWYVKRATHTHLHLHTNETIVVILPSVVINAKYLLTSALLTLT